MTPSKACRCSVPAHRTRHRRWPVPHVFSVLSLLVIFSLPATASAGLFAGLSPSNYAGGAPMDVLALNLFSRRVSVPYDYFSLPFCQPDPKRTLSASTETSLGQILLGERARLTAFDLRMRKDIKCAVLCTSSFSQRDRKVLARRIAHDYRVRLTLDDMPVVVRHRSSRHPYSLGYPLGYIQPPAGAGANVHGVVRDRLVAMARFLAVPGVTDESRSVLSDADDHVTIPTAVRAAVVRKGLLHGKVHGKVHLNNHLDFTVMYHRPEDVHVSGSSVSFGDSDSFRVVGFEVSARSVKYPFSHPDGASPVDPAQECVSGVEGTTTPQDPMDPQEILPPTSPMPQSVKFTYSVRFVESDVNWVTRFDTLLKVSQGRRKIQWLSIANSVMLALFLTAIFAAVLLRTLRRDCARYGFSSARNDILVDEFNDDFENDSGWRMLRGDVFRPPPAASLLCVLCGSGSQLTVVVFVTLAFAIMGVISPDRRGQLISSLVCLYVLSTSVAGYVASSMYRVVGGSRWRLVTFGVAVLLPGVAFATFVTVNTFLWAVGSVGAAPFGTLFLLLFLWLGVSVPLAFAGSYYGYMRKVYDFPVRTNQIPRQIPPQPVYLASKLAVLAAGILPFGIVGIELRLVLKSIMQQEIYHMFAFLLAVAVLLVVACAEVSVVLCYVRLANEDWGWWWPSFWAAGSSGLYVFAFSMYTLATSPVADAAHLVSNFLFVSYSALLAFGFALLTGSIGCLSSLAFVRRIFSVSSDD